MAEQQGVYEEFLEEQRRKRTTADDLEVEFAAYLEGQQRKKPASPSPTSAGASGDDLDSIIDEVMSGWDQSQPTPPPRPQSTTPAYIPPTERQEFNQVRPLDFDTELRLARQRQMRAESERRRREAEIERKRAEFEKLPLSTRFKERAYDALARAGGAMSRQARQITEAGMGVARGLNSGDFSPAPIEGWRRFESERNAELAERQAGRPSGGFLTETGEAVLEAAPQAGAAYLLTAAGLPAVAVGGGMSAAGADWSDPKRAATQTVIGAAAPAIGGKVGSAIGGRVATRMTNPVAAAAARIAGEVGGGGAGNVLSAGAEQLAFDGRLNPREMAKAGLVGSALSTPGAIGAGRPLSRAERYRAAVEATPTARLPQIAPAPQLGQTTRRLQPPPVRAEAGLPELAAVETAPTAPLKVESVRASVAGPRSGEAALNVGAQGASSAPGETPSLGRAIGSVLRTSSQAMRTFWTSMDLSAPLSQGAILSISHPVKGARSFKAMFRSLSAKQSAAIDAEIENHPLRQLGEDNGLYVATTGKAKGAPEEFYALEALNKLPGIRHSERAYRTYLDTLRLSTWESYVKSLDRAGYTPENNPKAYRQAAEWINIATGRGSLRPGGKLEKAMDLGGDILFAPRNLVANFQLLDPVRYASLSPGARKIVLRDATTAFGSMLGTAALLSAAGVRVGFNPERDDFMTARSGDTRYDLTFGKRTQVQFLARMMAGVYRNAAGEGNLPGRDPLSVAGRFAQSKLAPVYSTALTFARGRDYKGESVRNKSIGKVAWETAAPLLWRDLVEAYEQEGVKGVAKASPAVFGARVSTYPDKARPDWLPTSEAVRAEQKRLGLPRTFLTPLQHETAEVFRARHQRLGPAFASLADEMIRSLDYFSVDDEIRREAFAGLRRYIQARERRPARERSVEQIIYAAADAVARRKEREF